MIRWWWRHAGWTDRVTGLVLAAVVPLFWWTTITGRGDATGWLLGVASGVLLVWSVLAYRATRRELKSLEEFRNRFRVFFDAGPAGPGHGAGPAAAAPPSREDLRVPEDVETETFYVVPFARLDAMKACLAVGQDLDTVLGRETAHCLSPVVAAQTQERVRAARTPAETVDAGRVVSFTPGERRSLNTVLILFNMACGGLLVSVVGRWVGWWSPDTGFDMFTVGSVLFIVSVIASRRVGARAGKRIRKTPNVVD
jgi:Flp pilus assembly protein TadB